jgi:hypothetical protein
MNAMERVAALRAKQGEPEDTRAEFNACVSELSADDWSREDLLEMKDAMKTDLEANRNRAEWRNWFRSKVTYSDKVVGINERIRARIADLKKEKIEGDSAPLTKFP